MSSSLRDKGKEKYSTDDNVEDKEDPFHQADAMTNEQFERWLQMQQGETNNESEISTLVGSKLTLSNREHSFQWLISRCEAIAPDGGDMEATEMAMHICQILANNSGFDAEVQLQSDLLEFLGFEQIELISEILLGRSSILAGFRRAEKAKQQGPLPAHGPQVKISIAGNIIDHHRQGEENTRSTKKTQPKSQKFSVENLPNVYISRKSDVQPISSRISKMALPAGTEHFNQRDYESFVIPYHSTQNPRASQIQPVLVANLDAIAKSAFSGYTSLNRLQSAVYPVAYESNENMLVCAPTGAGKTDAAMLAVLKTIHDHTTFRKAEPIVDKDVFKIVYVAPMKALASEITAKFGRRLGSLGIRVQEYTGDMQLTRSQLEATQMLVTTPEKWDVVTRKSGGSLDEQDYRSLLIGKVRLLVLDEVHLLQDERGAVLEALVARTLRLVEQQQRMIRIVGLSATLPNFIDVAAFLGVNLQVGLFYFDEAFRPVPLRQTIIGVKSTAPQSTSSQDESSTIDDSNPTTVATKNNPPSKEHWSVKEATMRICFDRMIGFLRGEGSECMDRSRLPQVMIFVHSRNDTAFTARELARMAAEEGVAGLLKVEELNPAPSHRGHAGNHPILRDLKSIRNRDLRELVPLGFAIHHAGTNYVEE